MKKRERENIDNFSSITVCITQRDTIFDKLDFLLGCSKIKRSDTHIDCELNSSITRKCD